MDVEVDLIWVGLLAAWQLDLRSSVSSASVRERPTQTEVEKLFGIEGLRLLKEKLIAHAVGWTQLRHIEDMILNRKALLVAESGTV